METTPIATRKSACKDIDPTTIHRLYHEENMTIKGIAELCGICTATVRKYLGPVRRGLRPKPKNTVPIIEKEQVQIEQIRPKQLVQTKIELQGQTAKFEVDLEAGSVYARGAAFEMLLMKDEVEQFIWELVEAYGSMPRSAGPVANESAPLSATQ